MESRNNNAKLTITAIAGILFFSHFIKRSPHYLNETIENKVFLDHYLKIGEINLIFLIVDLFFLGMNFFVENIILEYGINLLSITILLLSFFAVLFAIGWYQIDFSQNEKLIPSQILKFFIPFYNVKLWIWETNYEKPSRRLKESILRWTISSFLWIFFWKTLWCIFLTIFWIRLFLLCLKIDIIPLQLKRDINKIFLKFPHEISAYLFYRIAILKTNHTETEILQQKKLLYQSPIPCEYATIKEKITLWILGIIPIGIFIITHISFKISWIAIFEIIMFLFFYLVFFSTFYYQYLNKKMFLRIPFLYELLPFHSNNNEKNTNL